MSSLLKAKPLVTFRFSWDSPLLSKHAPLLRKITTFVAQSGLFNHKITVPTAIQIALVKPTTMAQLNQQYRHHAGSTDVLSFQYGEKDLYGELYLSIPDIRRNAKEFSRGNLGDELAEMIIHGSLHLLGYTHGTSMFALQRKYVRLWYESDRRVG